jgi:glycosyltransferase involved in cell wall biosynthesis
LFYVETQRLKVWLENQTVKNVRWFPNVRECPSDEKDAKVYKKRLVYIGSVKETKGIKVIIDTAKKLDKSYTVDVYGPLDDCSIKKASFDHSSVVYKGVLRPVQVPSVLAKYDLLLLPTKHPGEGYPGVVIEAFSVGVVAIATRWGGIPELIDDQVNGVLMDGFETSALLEALAKVSSTNYERLSRGARESFDVFDATLVHKRVLFEINELHN